MTSQYRVTVIKQGYWHSPTYTVNASDSRQAINKACALHNATNRVRCVDTRAAAFRVERVEERERAVQVTRVLRRGVVV